MGFWNDFRTMRQQVKAGKEALKIAKANFIVNPTPENEQAMIGAKEIIVLVIAVFILAALIGSAIAALNATNQTGWSTPQIALFGVIPLVILAVIAMKIVE